MTISTSSKRWLQEHVNDYYVKQAKLNGYPSRAAYKLLEIQKKENLIQPGMTVVDIGAAPGGWSMVARHLVGRKGHVIALDKLVMQPISGVTFIQGDFGEKSVFERLLKTIEQHPVDLVISDLAPNITGNQSVDQSRTMYLVELAWESARQVLKFRGAFLVKVFQGEAFDLFVKNLRQNFHQVKIHKPKSSRTRSSEVYVLGKGFLGYNNESTLKHQR